MPRRARRHTAGVRAVLFCFVLAAAMPAAAQVRIHHEQEAHILRNARAGTEAEAPKAAPPLNLSPTQLLRCPDGKGGFQMQDTPCKAPTAPAGAAPASTDEVIDLSALPRREKVAEAPPRRVEETSRWTKALYGAGKLALILAALYGVYRLGRYARDRFRQRFGEPELPIAAPRRVR